MKDKTQINIIEEDVKVMKHQLKTLKRLVYELMEEVRSRD